MNIYNSSKLFIKPLSRYYYSTAASSSKPSKLYSFGCAIDGKLGNGRSEGYEAYPYLIDTKDNKIKSIYCGHYHSMFINKDLNLYSWGWTSFVGGEKGKKETNYKSTVPTSIVVEDEPNLRFIHASGGRRHTLAVTDDGKVYAFGVNSESQLGLGDKEHRTSPTLVKSLNAVNIIKTAAGWGHSLALSKDGDIYAWGWPNDGQLGIPNYTPSTPIPFPIKINNSNSKLNFKDIYAGSDYSMAIVIDDSSNTTKLYSWGSGEFGQLGLGDKNNRSLPNEIEGFQSIRAVSCGFSHTMIIDKHGDLYTFGWNGSGQLGLGDRENRYRPTLVDPSVFDGEKLKSVAAGRAHSVALTESGRLFTWGSAAKGKLGNGETSTEITTPQQLYDFDENQSEIPIVYNISTGFDHTLVETS